MKTQNFGIEIEMTGISRAAAARVITKYFGTEYNHVGGSYDAYHVHDNERRMWKIVSDNSIVSELANGNNASSLHKVELVSPICVYDDIVCIQETRPKTT